MKKYLILQNNVDENNKYNALSKARQDVYKVLVEKNNFEPFFLVSSSERIKKYFQLYYRLYKFTNNSREEKMAIIELPFYRLNRKAFINVLKKLKRKKIILVGLIHDIESLRFEKDKIQEDLEQYKLFDYIISHNEIMTKWLSDNGVKSKIINLDLFDYLIESHEKNGSGNKKSYKNIITIAGNLDNKKSGYIYELQKLELNDISFNLYGVNYDDCNLKNEKIVYKGSELPSLLPTKLEGKYGLVWDGQVLETCMGDTGEYTRYNNPHKLSLYVASGIPVIVWKHAAISNFVKKYNIGICIDNLETINEVMASISNSEYKEMYENVLSLREKVINGEFLSKAINKIDNTFN